MTSHNKLIAYALDFASFLIQKTMKKPAIINIILFGSAAREEADERSDVDLFINVVKETPALDREIKSSLEDFMNSAKYKTYWKLLGIQNEIKLTVGRLENWKELRTSIIANGILLYGKYKPAIKEGTHKVFFIWENVKPNSKRVLFNKQLFGYKQSGKFYEGLLQKYGGEKLGKGCIIISLDHTTVFHTIFKKYKISVKIKKVLEY